MIGNFHVRFLGGKGAVTVSYTHLPPKAAQVPPERIPDLFRDKRVEECRASPDGSSGGHEGDDGQRGNGDGAYGQKANGAGKMAGNGAAAVGGAAGGAIALSLIHI